MLHTDLHAAGFSLDPEFRHFLQHENKEVTSGFRAMVERVFPGDVESQVKAVKQHSSYRAGMLAYILLAVLQLNVISDVLEFCIFI